MNDGRHDVVVVLVGVPASGKSSLCRYILQSDAWAAWDVAHLEFDALERSCAVAAPDAPAPAPDAALSADDAPRYAWHRARALALQRARESSERGCSAQERHQLASEAARCLQR